MRWITISIVLTTSLAAFLIGGCAQSPVSGRPGVVLISAEEEREIGAEEARKVEGTLGLVEDPEKLVAYLKALGRRLAEHSPWRDVEYRFHVVDMAEPNAFALPGGYVYVSRGLLALVNSEDELAGVIAHEIAHVAARHAVQRVSVAAATSPLRIVAGIAGMATGIVAPRLGQVVAGVGQVASAFVLAPYSRDQEREADRIGQEIVASAGWDPNGITTILDTLGREEGLRSEGPRRSSFFSTHPTTPDRVARTTKHAAKLTAAGRHPIAKDRADLLGRLEGLLVGNDPGQGVFIDNRFLHPDLDLILRFPPKWEALNAPDFVGARSPDGDALVLLKIVGKGDDPLEVVKALEKQLKVRLLENATSSRIGDLPAVSNALVVRTSEGTMGVNLTWIAYRGLVYQITGVSPIAQFDDYQKVFLVTARSFRPLSTAERAEIQEMRLRGVRAREGETLEQLIERSDGAWTPAETAVANAIGQDARFQGGQLIKVPIRQPYSRP